MSKQPPEHKDILGRSLAVDDYVAYPDSNMMKIGKIDKLNPKMIRIATGREWRYNINKYPKDTVKLDGPDLTIHLLKSGS